MVPSLQSSQQLSQLQSQSQLQLQQQQQLHQQQQLQQQQQRLSPKDVWVQKYCTVEGLRSSFGRNQNLLWGDLDATNTRRLYKTLLPVALMELYQQQEQTSDAEAAEGGVVQPQDLALLAYKARVAAKLYARERCRVPARIAANLFDGYRQWRKYGSFDCTGMSYQQVWEKYATLIQQETTTTTMAGEHENETSDASSHHSNNNNNSNNHSIILHNNNVNNSGKQDITEQICLKILEKSCQSNAMIDELVLSNKKTKHRNINKKELAHLKAVQEQLERDVRLLLLSSSSSVASSDTQRSSSNNNNSDPTATTVSSSIATTTTRSSSSSNHISHNDDYPLRHDNIHRWSVTQAQKFRALRAFAKFKRRFAALQHHHQHSQNTLPPPPLPPHQQHQQPQQQQD